jgi:hypothetical protein
MGLVRASTTFHGPDHLVVDVGETFDENDPIVRARPELFEPIAVGRAGAGFGGIEQATAVPGEKRSGVRKAVARKVDDGE